MKHDCDCGDAVDQLYQYLDSELDPETAASVRSHLEDCNGCEESFQFERRLKSVIRDHLTEEMPRSLEEKVKELIHEETSSFPQQPG